MEEKKLYVVHTDYMTTSGICDNDVTIVKASSEESAVAHAACLLLNISTCACVGWGFACEATIVEAFE